LISTFFDLSSASSVSSVGSAGWLVVKRVNFFFSTVTALLNSPSIFCSVIVYPVIPKGQIELRIIPTAAHTDQDIDETLAAFAAVREKLEKKLYPQEMPMVGA